MRVENRMLSKRLRERIRKVCDENGVWALFIIPVLTARFVS